MAEDLIVNEQGNEIGAVDNTLLSVIERIAANPDADLNKLEKMLDMQERIINKRHEQEFYDALAKLKSDIPSIAKKELNSQTSSKYAKLGTILDTIDPILARHEFTISFEEQKRSPEEVDITVLCMLSYKNGYTKSVPRTFPIDNVGLKGSVCKTKIHGIASAGEYCKRYALCDILGIAIVDDDGNAAGGSPELRKVTKFQAGILCKALMSATDAIQEEFSRYYADENDVPASEFSGALNRLKGQSNANT